MLEYSWQCFIAARFAFEIVVNERKIESSCCTHGAQEKPNTLIPSIARNECNGVCERTNGISVSMYSFSDWKSSGILCPASIVSVVAQAKQMLT